MFLTTFEGFKGHNISVSFFYSASQLAQSLGELVSVHQTFGRTVCCGQNIVTHTVPICGGSKYCQRKMATYKKLSQQMSVCCGQSFVKVKIKLLLFSAQFPFWPTNVDVRIFHKNSAHARQNSFLANPKNYTMCRIHTSPYFHKLFGIFFYISQIIAEIVWDSLVWLLSCCRVCIVQNMQYLEH